MIDLEEVRLSCSQCSLSELCLPRGLSPEEIADLEVAIDQKSPLDRDQMLYRSGDTFTAFYAVKSGALKTTITSADGEEQIIGFHLAGELVGFDGLGTQRYSCDCSALQRTTVCRMPVSKLEDLCAAYPSLRRELHSVIGKTINADQSMLLLLAQRTADEKVASFLLSLSNRNQLRGYSETLFELPMSMRDIANYLGLAPETLSRLIKKFKTAGIVSITRGRVEIVSEDGLRGIVAECSTH